jgi:ubiquinone/menaquinone biosynthesis C-methylase UbiE
MNDDSYFKLYEDRFRRLKEQGVEDWIAEPAENTGVIASVDEFLKNAGCHPSHTSIIEFGCGQGHLAANLLSSGYRYLGIDISESAIRNARKKAGEKGEKAFLLANTTDLPQIPDGSFNIAIDNQCWHMLVTDRDRASFLSEAKRILKSNGKAFFRENVQPEEFTAQIASFKEFVETVYGDDAELHDYPAYIDGKQKIIRLPRIPARANNERGYRKELQNAGFVVDQFRVEGTHCIIYVHV